jgi:hypothetical protein
MMLLEVAIEGSKLSPNTELASILILDFSDFTTLRNKFLFFVIHPMYGIPVTIT